MADLLPTLSSSSDEEEEEDKVKEKDNHVVSRKGKRGGNGKPPAERQQPTTPDDDNDDDDDVAMNRDFQFGGILGEDGGGVSNNYFSIRPKGWNFQSTIDALDDHQAKLSGVAVDGTNSSIIDNKLDVAALIAAKRNALLQTKKQKQQSQQTNDHQSKQSSQEKEQKLSKSKRENNETNDNDAKGEEREEAVAEKDEADCDSSESSKISDGSNDKNDDEDDKNKGDEEGDHEDYSENEDDDDDDDDDDDEESDHVDDADREMEQDVLKTRAAATSAGKNGRSINNNSKNGNDDDDGLDNENEPAETEDSSDEDGNDHGSDDDDDNEEDQTEKRKAAKFFDNNHVSTSNDDIQVFAQLTLSRPLLLGVASMGFVKPTPIQSKVIPIALMGRDVCASAVTGSGKTAAFLLPICERLLHRATSSSGQQRIKALILTPTRELAAQCIGMLTSLTQHCPDHVVSLRSSLIVGGSKNVQAQAAELRTRRPAIVVATPGRLLDHVTNSMGVSLEDVEFLVLDEADRLLDLGFQEEVHELVKTCPKEQRQTMLFSATMTTKVDELIKLSLKRPVRVHITGATGTDHKNASSIEVAPRLEQEFVRVRAGNEGINREALLLALLTPTFTRHTIVFFDTKVTAHRLMILCGLCGIKCAELHGNLTQAQRLTALEQFRQGHVDVLLATDLAARGLDIDRVETVINFEMPSQIETYVHRIGRTARAGRGGKSCTLIGEGRRHLMKEVIKDADDKKKRNHNNKNSGNNKSGSSIPSETTPGGVIRSRTIPPAVIGHFVAKIQSLEEHVKEVLQAEEVARMDRLAEMEAIRAHNMIAHADEIQARPQREWFASKQQKEMTKQRSLAEKQKISMEEIAGTGTHRMSRKKRRAREARESQQRAAADSNPQDDTNDGGGEEGVQQKMKKAKIVTEQGIKASARTQKKKKMEMKEQELVGRSVHDDDQFEKQQQKQNSKLKRKGAFAADAAGDSTLFDEERVTFARKRSKPQPTDGDFDKPATSSFHFRGYDPDKAGSKKAKKKSAHHAFKSKSKYKRRK